MVSLRSRVSFGCCSMMTQVEERGVDMFHLPRGMQKNDVVKIFKVEDEDDLKKQLGLQ